MGRLQLYLFGPPRLELEGVRVAIARRRTWALLAYLGLTAQEHTRDHLVAFLWPDNEPASAYANLRRELTRLKKALGEDLLKVDRTRVWLPAEDASDEELLWLDVRAFRQHLERVRRHDHLPEQLCAACRSGLEHALLLYQDEFMHGFSLLDSAAYDDWQYYESQSLRVELAEMLEIVVRWHSGQGEFERGIEVCRRWVELDPLAEPAQRWLMKLYTWNGQTASAGRQYEDLTRRLKADLGIAPDETTRELWESIRNRRLPVPQSSPTRIALQAERQALVKLPDRLPSFVGRAADLERLARWLPEPGTRLVTLVGLGGVGKTSLAIAAAHQVREAFLHGVVFVALAGVDKVELLPGVLARELELPLGGQVEALEEVSHFLGRRQVLLILDNFEHLLEGVPVVQELLDANPGLTLLVTSREPLYLDRERRLDLEGLAYPEPDADLAAQYDAVELFLLSACLALGDYTPGPEELAVVHHLCRMVAGLPLAIKLAANWLRMMTARQIARQLEENLDLLTSRMRDIPERQSSLRAIYEQTWGYLLPGEQQALASLSVLRGVFDQSGAMAVSGVNALDLAGLVDRGLLQFHRAGHYSLHTITRQFGREKLQASDQEDQVMERFGRYYLRLLSQALPELRGAQPQATLKALRLSLENIRQAWNWACLAGEWSLVDLAAEALAEVYELSGLLAIGEHTFDFAAAGLEMQAGRNYQLADGGASAHAAYLPDDLLALVCRLHIYRMQFRLLRGASLELFSDLEALRELAMRSKSKWCQANARFLTALTHMYLNEHAVAVPEMQAVADEFADLDDPRSRATVLNHVGESLARLNRSAESLQYLMEALDIGRRLGDARLQALTESHLGVGYYYSDDYLQAVASWERALHIFEALEDLRDQARTANNLGFVYHILGGYEEAVAYAERAVAIFKQIGDRLNEGNAMDTLGAVYLVLGDYVRARASFEQGLTILSQTIGRAMDEAMFWVSLAEVDLATGDYTRARTELASARRVISENAPLQEATRLVGMEAALEARLGEHRKALELYDRALLHLEESGERTEHARLSLQKGLLLLDMENWGAAATCLEQAHRDAQATARLPVRFGVGIALARLYRQTGDLDGALVQLEILEELVLTDLDRAALAYERWQVTRQIEAGLRALALYRQLAARTRDVLCRERLQELQEMVAEVG